MGMVLGLVSIGDESIDKILADPPLIWKVLAPDDPGMYESVRAENAKSGSWFSRVLGKKREPAPPREDLAEIEVPVEEVDLDKAWHGIHYLLTKTAWGGDWPLSFLVLGGEEVGDIDVGYGTARAFYSPTVREISQALEPINAEILESRFDGQEMSKLDIYPDIWDRDPAEDPVLEYCIEYFDSLKAFVMRSSEQGLGMLVYIS